MKSMVCQKCALHCLECSTTDANKCDNGQCTPGYTLEIATGLCKLCADNCTTCDIKGEGLCDAAMCIPPQQTDVAFGCTNSCSSSCKSCTIAGSGKCDTCEPGYRLNTENYQCNTCDSGLYKCIECLESSNICSKCEEGFSVNNITSGKEVFTKFKNDFKFKSCIRCAFECAECMLSGYADCDICNAGYSLVKSKEKTLC